MKILLTLTLTLLALTAQAYNLNVNAKAAFLYHPTTSTILYNHNGNEKISPASLAKLMTLYLLFDAIKNDTIKMDSALPISKKAWRKGGSKMFLEVGKTAKVEDLIKGIIISSGNDACIVVAEYLGGTEDGFARMMTAKAKTLGLNNTNFTNSTGWPDPNQYTTARDMVQLSTSLMRDFPNFYHYFAGQVFTYNGITQRNRNGLLKAGLGVDGLKTGHTEESGFHLVSSAQQNGERLVAAVLGTDGFAAREGESLKLLRYGFTQNHTLSLWNEGDIVATAPVWLGTAPQVELLVANSTSAFLPRSVKTPQNIQIKYIKPLPAPIKAGQQVGQIFVEIEGKTFTSPLVASANVPKAGFFNKFLQKLFYRFGL